MRSILLQYAWEKMKKKKENELNLWFTFFEFYFKKKGLFYLTGELYLSNVEFYIFFFVLFSPYFANSDPDAYNFGLSDDIAKVVHQYAFWTMENIQASSFTQQKMKKFLPGFFLQRSILLR